MLENLAYVDAVPVEFVDNFNGKVAVKTLDNSHELGWNLGKS